MCAIGQLRSRVSHLRLQLSRMSISPTFARFKMLIVYEGFRYRCRWKHVAHGSPWLWKSTRQFSRCAITLTRSYYVGYDHWCVILNVLLASSYDVFHIVGSVAQIIGYTLAAPAPPFPVFVMGYFMNGLGIALQVSLDSRTSCACILTGTRRTQVLTVTSPPSKTARPRRWAFCTPFTVCTWGEHGFLSSAY